MKKVSCLILLIPFLLSGQVRELNFIDDEEIIKSKLVVHNNLILAFYVTQSHDADVLNLNLRTSSNNGVDWSNVVFVDTLFNYSNVSPQVDAIELSNNQCLLIYKGYSNYWIKRVIDENQLISGSSVIPTYGTSLTRRLNNDLSIAQNLDGSISLVHTRGGIVYSKSLDNGETWTEPVLITENLTSDPNIVSIDLNTYLLFFVKDNNEKKAVYSIRSSNSGNTWSTNPALVLSDNHDIINPTAFKDANGTINLLVQASLPSPFVDISNEEILCSKSSDNGISWSEPVKITNYLGYDGDFNLSYRDSCLLSFKSTMYNVEQSTYFGFISNEFDMDNIPAILKVVRYYSSPECNLLIRVFMDSNTPIQSAYVKYYIQNKNSSDSLLLYDDGTHNDSLYNDKIFGNIITGLQPDRPILISYVINNNNRIEIFDTTLITPYASTYDAVRINVNNLNIPIDRKGIIGGVNIPDPNPLISGTGGKYDDKIFLFSGGFFLSGFQTDYPWTNAVATSSLLEDYLPGQINEEISGLDNKIYVVRSSDSPFSYSWQSWKKAVEKGAYFYDGNNDGIYNPVDLNNNGLWDYDEDRPDLLGHITTWSVYNDGVPAPNRRFGVDPIGIEIRQSLFAVAGSEENALNNSIFLRYSIVNKNSNVLKLDSVFFSLWADVDLGDHLDDYIGCDTTINSGFVYNKTADQVYGDNCPSAIFTLLQSPPVYQPGITFNDVNQNLYYDEGIDIPLDTAYNRLGNYLGATVYPGAMNMGINSFFSYISGDPALEEPNNAYQARNYMLGKNKNGEWIDPCTFPYGNVFNQSCNHVKSNYLFSGDPVTEMGWIDTSKGDDRILLTVGPFSLEYNKPVDIICAYSVGKGQNSLASVNVAKSYAQSLINSYNNNFSDFPTSVKNNSHVQLPSQFELFNNYPNPFNPVTIIKYGVKEKAHVKIEVFDILGRRISTLVNEEISAGYHEILFDGSSLSTGVYIYRFTTDKVNLNKKMVLIK